MMPKIVMSCLKCWKMKFDHHENLLSRTPFHFVLCELYGETKIVEGVEHTILKHKYSFLRVVFDWMSAFDSFVFSSFLDLLDCMNSRL